MGGPTLN